jgi:hypothetical protein
MIFFEITHFIANIFIGFFNFLTSSLILKVIVGVPAAYVFFSEYIVRPNNVHLKPLVTNS